MSMPKRISRRTTLKGLGIALALPWLESMGPMSSWGASVSPTDSAPNRLAFLYVPNGVNMADWTPAKDGTDFELPSILESLNFTKDQLLVLTGLTADKARANGDGPGDHARALAAFLTGVQPRKTDGTDIRAGVSVDQVAASRVGQYTRLPSLEIGVEGGAMSGNCDSGYSCVYSSTMSWRSATQPLPKEINPKAVFERLFGGSGDASQEARNTRRRSVLDYVLEDSRDLSRSLGANDVRKLDEYFSSVRDLEVRIARASELAPVTAPEYDVPDRIPELYEDHIRIMADMMFLAFQADITRVCTFVLANEGSNRSYKFIDVPEGHHDLSHHGNEEEKKEKIKRINTFHSRQLAYLLEKLRSTQEGDGTLLDHCMIAYGSGNSDGNRHNHDDLPILVAGGGCGTLRGGRHLRVPSETPLNNLWLSLLDRMEIQMEQLGDSTGRLSDLT